MIFFEDLENAVPVPEPVSETEFEDREQKQFLKQFGEGNLQV